MTSKELQGWHADPFGLHEMRYFSAGRPTKLVRDGRAEAYDEPPDDWPAVVAASSSQAMPATELAAVSDPAGPTRVLAATRNDVAAATTVAAPSPYTQQRRRRMEYVFVAAGAVVAVLVFVALAGGPSKPGIASAAFVTRAAQRTLAQTTADYTLSATATVARQSLAMGGRGQVDLAHDAMSFTVGASTASGSITENELQIGGNRYVAITVNGHNLALSGGRHWLEAPFAPTAAQSFANSSPDSSLALLSQQGARVTELGSQSIGGRTCNGYAVTPSQQAMLAGARQAFAREGMSAAATNAALQVLRNVQPPTMTAWFDSHSNLACRLDFYLQFGTPTSSGLGEVQAQLTFTHYGAPVKITAPPPSDTFSVEQYLRSATHV